MITCKEALDQYYQEHAIPKVVDRRRLEYAMESLNLHFASTPLSEVDIPLCRDYMLFRCVSASTVRRELGVLQAAANHARKWRRIPLDRMPSIELPSAPASRPIWLYKDELSHLLEIAEKGEERPFRFCQLAYHTASRKEAIEVLEWDQVSFEPNRIDLQHPSFPVTKKRRPIVSVSDAMAEVLASMQSNAKNRWVLGDKSNIRHPFEALARKAGLAYLPKRGLREAGHLTPHILRHSRATHLLQDGKKPFAVANLLGDSIQTVLQVYGHACSDYMAETLS